MQTTPNQHHVHEHVFDSTNPAAERGTRAVMWISAAMMVIEIIGGYALNSMALLADGWHMSSHTLAIGLSALAYAAARKYAKDPRFAFGTWKIEVLGGFTSAIFLLGVALTMVVSSLERIYEPQAIVHREAVWVAVLGLAVNWVCAMILAKSGQGHDHHGHAHHGHDDHKDHHHGPHHHHDQPPPQVQHHRQPQDVGLHVHHGHEVHEVHEGEKAVSLSRTGGLSTEVQAHLSAAQGHDLNLRSAYIHILADAATSVLAIVSLLLGWAYGWDFLDPLVGLLGAVLIALWSKNLLTETAKVLLDCEMDHPKFDQVKRCILDLGGQELALADLHVWRVGKKNFSCAVVVVTTDAQVTPHLIRSKLMALGGIAHTTIEVNHL